MAKLGDVKAVRDALHAPARVIRETHDALVQAIHPAQGPTSERQHPLSDTLEHIGDVRKAFVLRTSGEQAEIESTLHEWRTRVLYALLVVIAVTGLPAYASVTINAIQTAQMTPLLWVYLAVYFALLGLAVYPRLDFRLRASGLLLLGYTNALASFARLGLAGSGRLYLITLPVIATIIVGSRAGYITGALSLVIYAAFTGLAQAGLLGNWLTVTSNPLSLAFWLEAGAALAVFLVLLVVLLERFYGLLVRTLAARRQSMLELEQATRRLKEREERLALVMQGTRDGIWDWNLETNEVYFSPRWKAMLGYEEDEIAHHFEAWRSLVHPDDIERAMAEIKAHLDGVTPLYTLEHRLLHKDGTYRWILARGTALRDAIGKPYRMAGSHTDITERVRAEEALRESEEKFRGIVELANVGVAIVQDAWFRFVNRHYASMLGYKVEDMLDTQFIGYCAPEERERIVDLYTRRARGETVPTRYETAIMHKNGERVHVEVSAGLIQYEGQPATFMFLRDVTKRKRAEEALRASEAEMRALLAAMTDVILVLDREGRYMRIAPTNPELLYRPPSDLLGKTLHQIFPQAQADFFLDNIRHALEARQPVDFEYSLPIDGVQTWFAATVSPMNGDTVVWVARDITPRVQAEAALQERLAFEKLITSISTEFINLGPQEMDRGIQHALQLIGEFTGADRSYVFQFSPDGDTIDNTHEWCAPGIEPHIGRLQGIPASSFLFVTERIKNLDVLYVPCVADLPPEASSEQEEFQREGIQSLVCVAMVYRGSAIGFLGFDSVRSERAWPRDTVILLTIVGEIFVNALKNKQAQEALESAYQTLERRVEERTQELSTLNAIAAIVNRSLDLKEVLRDALDKTLEVVATGCGGAYRLEGNSDEPDSLYLNPLVYRGMSEDFIRFAGKLPLCGSAVEVAARSGEPLVWQVRASPAETGMKQALEREGIRQVVSIPLMAKGRLVGALQLGMRDVRSLAPEQLSLLAAIGQQVGVAVENARLYEQAEQAAAMAERSRLARELHDSVTQGLYSVTLYAEAAARLLNEGNHQTAANHLRDLRDTAQEALREMRLLIFELRPPELEKIGLAATLQARLKAVEARGGMQAELHVEGAQAAERVPIDIQQELYHLIQEALNNVLKHARAQHVQVYLHFLEATTRAEVVDDGVGFEPTATRGGGGLGLAGMQERAQRMGGRLEIESAPGKGARVAIEVPGTTREPV